MVRCVGNDNAPNDVNIVQGTNGNDNPLRGGRGADRICGRNGHDRLWGRNGNDHLYGDSNNDVLRGEAGNDALIGDLGNDRMFGGLGFDTFYVLCGTRRREVGDADNNDDIYFYEENEPVEFVTFESGIDLNSDHACSRTAGRSSGSTAPLSSKSNERYEDRTDVVQLPTRPLPSDGGSIPSPLGPGDFLAPSLIRAKFLYYKATGELFFAPNGTLSSDLTKVATFIPAPPRTALNVVLVDATSTPRVYSLSVEDINELPTYKLPIEELTTRPIGFPLGRGGSGPPTFRPGGGLTPPGGGTVTPVGPGTLINQPLPIEQREDNPSLAMMSSAQVPPLSLGIQSLEVLALSTALWVILRKIYRNRR